MDRRFAGKGFVRTWAVFAASLLVIYALTALPLQPLSVGAQKLGKGEVAERPSDGTVDSLTVDKGLVKSRGDKTNAVPEAAGQLFTARLSGPQETPPNASPGTGFGTVSLNEAQNTITVSCNFSGLVANANNGHIHTGAVGVAGPVTFGFTGVPAATSGSIPVQSFPITPAQLATLQSGGMYFNIHSSTFPGGEIRGQITPAASSDTEPNNTPATASPIATTVRLTGNIYPNADIDYYSFSATAGDKVYSAVMTSFSANASSDSQLRIIGTDGVTELEFDEDDGSLGTLSSTIAGVTIPSTGTYYIRVNHFSATNQLRPYDLYLKVQSGTPTPEIEPNDTPATANVLPASGWVSGARNPAAATEQDWFSFTANAGDTVYLGLDLDPERDNVQWDGRLGIALFGDSSNQILVVNDASVGSATNPLSEALFMTVKTAGTYYAFVDSASAAVGGPTATYNLSVTVFPKVNEGVNCTTYTSTDVPQTIPTGPGIVSSTITVPGNPRIADLDVSIQLNHTVMADIDAHLRSPSGNDNGLFTDIGAAATGGQAQMDLTLDDEAAIPPAFTVLKGINYKPELSYRLSWFDGENAGGVWTLDLRDDVAANGGTLTGWSMTVCEAPPPPSCPVGFAPTTIFSTDFESGAAGFTHSGTLDEWELGTPATVATAGGVAAFSNCNSGVNCWKTDLDNTYDASSTQDLLSPPINLTNVVGPIVVNWSQRYQIENATFDHMFVDAQQVGGATPVRLFEFLDATMTNGVGNPTVTIGESAGWGRFSRRADSLAGLNSELRFHVDSDTTVQLGGMAVDDVSVTGCVASGPVNELLYATSGNNLISFNSTAPTVILTTVAITGLQSGETIVDWDLRPLNGNLVAVGSTSRLYLINPTTGAASQIGAAGQFTLSGTAFGTDFNPTVDRIRNVSDTEQNIRLNPNNGALAGTDTALNPAGNVVSVAYDRNDNDPGTLTTLFGIDSVAGTLIRIGGVDGTPSPNTGTITTIGSLGLGLNLDPSIGFDISGTTGIAYATISDANPPKPGESASAVNPRLYTINLTTGAATLVGVVGNGSGGAYQGLTAASVPTASGVTVGGRVLTAEGRGLTNAVVTITDPDGSSRSIITGRNGFFSFDEVEAGRSYVVSVRSRRYLFSPRLVEVNDNVSDIEFYPEQ